MVELFKSNVFNYNFDFDEWPATSTNTITMLRPYNKSMFKLRFEYVNIFKDLYEDLIEKERSEMKQASKEGVKEEDFVCNERIYKIKY